MVFIPRADRFVPRPGGWSLLAEKRRERAAPGAAHRQHAAVVQGDAVVAAGPRLELADAIEVDDGRSMDAREPPRIEPRLQRGERLAHRAGFLAADDAQVVAVGLDVVDVGDAHEADLAAA